VLRPPIHSPHAPSPAYKRPPLLAGKMRLTSLYLPDNLLSAFDHPVELAGASRSPRPPPVPSNPGAPPTHRLIKVTEKTHRSRPAPSPPVSLPIAASSQYSRSLCRRAGEEGFPDTDSVLTAGPLRSGSLFLFLFFFFSRAHPGSLAGPARVWVAGPF
jgi:hypothetical protein